MIRTMRKGVRALAMTGGLLFVVGGVSAATWVQDGRPNEPAAPKPCNCSPIMGTVGKIGPWGTTGAGSSKSQTTAGEYGGHWDGSRWPICPMASASQNDTLEHKYKKISGSSNRYLRIEVRSTPKYSGSATEMTPTVPASWWWICSCVVNQKAPTASYKTSSTADPITIGVEEVNNTDGTVDGGNFGPTDPVTQPPANPMPAPATYPVPAGRPHNPPNRPRPPDPLAPAPVTNPGETTYPKSNPGYNQNDPHRAPNGSGEYWARSHAKVPSGAVSISVKMDLDAAASISSDNAAVSDWKNSLMIEFTSEMSSSKPPKP